MAVICAQTNLKENRFWGEKLQRFMEIQDRNKDGLIERADFKRAVQGFMEIGTAEEQLRKLTYTFGEAYDLVGIVDDSVTLTYDEFTNRFAKQVENFLKKGIGGNLFQSMFEAVDADGDSKISFKEWVHYYKALDINTEHARASFDAMDTNCDGVVSSVEFNAYCTEFFFSTEDTLKSSILYGPLNLK